MTIDTNSLQQNFRILSNTYRNELSTTQMQRLANNNNYYLSDGINIIIPNYIRNSYDKIGNNKIIIKNKSKIKNKHQAIAKKNNNSITPFMLK